MSSAPTRIPQRVFKDFQTRIDFILQDGNVVQLAKLFDWLIENDRVPIQRRLCSNKKLDHPGFKNMLIGMESLLDEKRTFDFKKKGLRVEDNEDYVKAFALKLYAYELDNAEPERMIWIFSMAATYYHDFLPHAGKIISMYPTIDPLKYLEKHPNDRNSDMHPVGVQLYHYMYEKYHMDRTPDGTGMPLRLHRVRDLKDYWLEFVSSNERRRLQQPEFKQVYLEALERKDKAAIHRMISEGNRYAAYDQMYRHILPLEEMEDEEFTMNCGVVAFDRMGLDNAAYFGMMGRLVASLLPTIYKHNKWDFFESVESLSRFVATWEAFTYNSKMRISQLLDDTLDYNPDRYPKDLINEYRDDLILEMHPQMNYLRQNGFTPMALTSCNSEMDSRLEKEFFTRFQSEWAGNLSQENESQAATIKELKGQIQALKANREVDIKGAAVQGVQDAGVFVDIIYAAAAEHFRERLQANGQDTEVLADILTVDQLRTLNEKQKDKKLEALHAADVPARVLEQNFSHPKDSLQQARFIGHFHFLDHFDGFQDAFLNKMAQPSQSAQVAPAEPEQKPPQKKQAGPGL